MIKIPLPTKYDYFVCDHGFVWKGKILMQGTKKLAVRTSPKKYIQYGLRMADGSHKFFYGQRLSAMCYHELLHPENEGKIVLHLTEDTFYNAPHAIMLGDQALNQNEHRLQSGTYFNRGRKKKELEPNTDECPF